MTENKSKVAYYIFTTTPEGENKRIGTAFRHHKGNGLNIVIDKARYVAFPPKAKPQPEGGA